MPIYKNGSAISHDIYHYIYELIIPNYWGICSTNRQYPKDASGVGHPKHPSLKNVFVTSHDTYHFIYELIVPNYWGICSTNR